MKCIQYILICHICCILSKTRQKQLIMSHKLIIKEDIQCICKLNLKGKFYFIYLIFLLNLVPSKWYLIFLYQPDTKNHFMCTDLLTHQAEKKTFLQ